MTIQQELASVAQTLQAATQILLSLSEPPETGEPPAREAEEPAAGRELAEYRCYRVPFHVLDDERELLAEYETERIADVLHEIHTDFYLMLELMKGYAEQFDDEDYIYSLVAQKLLKPLDRLGKAHSVLGLSGCNRENR